MSRFDETWHRLREWTNGQAPSERMAAQILSEEGYEGIDPSHPLGGRDGGRDAHCTKDGKSWIMGVYFPRGQQTIGEITAKFKEDLAKARTHSPGGFVFVTNQELTLSERATLSALGKETTIELYHLERITLVLDKPVMAPVRKQFLDIDAGPLPIQVELKIGGPARYFTDSEGARERYITNVSDQQRKKLEKEAEPPANRFGIKPVQIDITHAAMYGSPPPVPRNAEQVEQGLQEWADRVRDNWESSESYLAARAWAPLQFELQNVGEVFLNAVQVIITIDNAFGVAWKGEEAFEFDECIEPFVKPTRSPYFAPPMPNLSGLRTRDYPISWKNVDEQGQVEITIDLQYLRPHPTWRSDRGDLVVFVLEEDVRSLTAEWTITAQGYGNFFSGPPVEISVENSPFAETLIEMHKAAGSG